MRTTLIYIHLQYNTLFEYLYYPKGDVEIELECKCVYSYKYRTAGSKGISIGLLRTAFFHMQNYKNIQKYIVKCTNTM